VNRATGPRIGPDTSASGHITIWVRLIRGTAYLFWAWPDRIDVYRVPEDHQPQLVRSFTKETT
jgi:hypothetical protein